MSIEQIIQAINQMERTLFNNSLQRPDMVELEQSKEKVQELKDAFIETSYVGCNITELEEIRFKLVEITLSTAISIKERLHQDISPDIRSLERLYKTA